MANEQVAQEYAQRKERVATLTNLTLQSTDGTALPPTPTQEENDKLALGLIHPDEKAIPPQDKAMPPLAVQQAYLAGAGPPAGTPSQPIVTPPPGAPSQPIATPPAGTPSQPIVTPPDAAPAPHARSRS